MSAASPRAVIVGYQRSALSAETADSRSLKADTPRQRLVVSTASIAQSPLSRSPKNGLPAKLCAWRVQYRGMLDALPPTSPSLMDDTCRPYFLWWTTATVRELRAHLVDPDPDVRAYWIGALLREANTRDVWLFVTPDVIRASWERLQRHLGRSRAMWAYLLGLPDRPWPPRHAAAR